MAARAGSVKAGFRHRSKPGDDAAGACAPRPARLQPMGGHAWPHPPGNVRCGLCPACPSHRDVRPKGTTAVPPVRSGAPALRFALRLHPSRCALPSAHRGNGSDPRLPRCTRPDEAPLQSHAGSLRTGTTARIRHPGPAREATAAQHQGLPVGRSCFTRGGVGCVSGRCNSPVPPWLEDEARRTLHSWPTWRGLL